MLADGTVGGIVFAEARTDVDVGYALTPTSVRIAIGPALGRTGAVANDLQDWRRKIEQEHPPCRFVAVVQPLCYQRQGYANRR